MKKKDLYDILSETLSGFYRHNVFKLSASLSFYTIFSIGPMMLVIIFISSNFFSRQAIEGSLYGQIEVLIGSEAALQVQELIRNTSLSSNSIMAVIGFTLLFFAATTVFTEIQDSMNIIWDLQVKKNKNWQQTLVNRIVSFLIITCLGLLLLIILIINGLLDGLMDQFVAKFPKIAINLVYAANIILTLVIVTILFGFIYKVLPDVNIRWRHVATGALFASILFMIGKFGVTFYINSSNMNSTYSSAGSLVILLLWTYYSATILYLGAEFTKAYAIKYYTSVQPRSYAVRIKTVTMEDNEIR
ncbi:MAG TPA: YihY/virulence factor BrkB family protein [Bacteroidales bacterium]|nr:YihY/virulence factor BrkB family protein [Bacteroidales bacterium]